jgi:phosphoribosylglycinamide formyltransferase-1
VNVGVLASGEGTNLQAILDRLHGRGAVEVVAVASDRAGSRALERARAAGVPARAFAVGEHSERRAGHAAIADWLEQAGVELVVLAGYMRLLDPGFLARFPQRVINVHPALLPAFPGIGAIEQALAYGVKVFGVTVHLVDEGVDTGPILAQRALELPDAAGPDEVRAALRPLEHDLVCDVIRLIARGALASDPGNPRRLAVGQLYRAPG